MSNAFSFLAFSKNHGYWLTYQFGSPHRAWLWLTWTMDKRIPHLKSSNGQNTHKIHVSQDQLIRFFKRLKKH